MHTPTFSPRPRPNRAIVAGFCASAASGLVLLFAHITAKIVHQGLGGAAPGALVDNSLTALAATNLYLAVALHFLVGISLAWLYMKLRPHLPENSWTAILCFLIPPYLFSVVVLFPLTGGGVFGLEYGAGLLPALGSLVLHAVYGLTLVGLYEKIGLVSDLAQMQDNSVQSDLQTPQLKYAAIGIFGGTGIGVAISAVLWFFAKEAFTVPGLPIEFTVMALIFFFSSMGLLIGFWTGIPVRRNVALDV